MAATIADVVGYLKRRANSYLGLMTESSDRAEREAGRLLGGRIMEYVEAVEDLEEKATPIAESGWRSIADRPPSIGEQVIAWGPSMAVAVVEFSDLSHPDAKKYTHWMPVPKPP